MGDAVSLKVSHGASQVHLKLNVFWGCMLGGGRADQADFKVSIEKSTKTKELEQLGEKISEKRLEPTR